MNTLAELLNYYYDVQYDKTEEQAGRNKELHEIQQSSQEAKTAMRKLTRKLETHFGRSDTASKSMVVHKFCTTSSIKALVDVLRNHD
jgi:hypothetical protein